MDLLEFLLIFSDLIMLFFIGGLKGKMNVVEQRRKLDLEDILCPQRWKCLNNGTIYKALFNKALCLF